MSGGERCRIAGRSHCPVCEGSTLGAMRWSFSEEPLPLPYPTWPHIAALPDRSDDVACRSACRLAVHHARPRWDWRAALRCMRCGLRYVHMRCTGVCCRSQRATITGRAGSWPALPARPLFSLPDRGAAFGVASALAYRLDLGAPEVCSPTLCRPTLAGEPCDPGLPCPFAYPAP